MDQDRPGNHGGVNCPSVSHRGTQCQLLEQAESRPKATAKGGETCQARTAGVKGPPRHTALRAVAQRAAGATLSGLMTRGQRRGAGAGPPRGRQASAVLWAAPCGVGKPELQAQPRFGVRPRGSRPLQTERTREAPGKHHHPEPLALFTMSEFKKAEYYKQTNPRENTRTRRSLLLE